MARCTILLLLVYSIASIAKCSAIQIRDNGGYTNVVVAISPTLLESNIENLHKTLEKVFQEASSFLHLSTRKYFYFEEIIFALPATFDPTLWSQIGSSEKAKSFSEPDVVLVEDLNPEAGFRTVQHDGCGKHGLRIYFSASKLQNSTASKAFVHEWVHYRYGVFDEHGFLDDSVYPLIYRTPGIDNDVSVTGCTDKKPFYSFKNSSGFSCDPFIKDCIPVLEVENNPEIVSSLMDQTTSATANQFCDGQLYNHNRDVPSMQNNLCREKSIWQVISESADFRQRNPVKLLPTRFRYILDSGPRVVFVIEATDKMQTNSRMELVRNAIAYFLLYDFPIDGKISLLNLRRLGSITWSSDAESLLDMFPDAYGNIDVCVSCGIKEAAKILMENGGSNGYIISVTVTDISMEELNDMKNTLDSSLRLVALYFGDSLGNPPHLQDLAESTKGRFFHVLETQRRHNTLVPLTFLHETFRSIYESFSWTNRLKTLVDHKVFYEESTECTMYFAIDDSIESFQIVMTSRDFLSNPPLLMDTVLLKYNDSAQPASFAYKRRVPAYVFTILQPQVGMWQLTFQRKYENPRPVVVIVRATNRYRNEAVTLTPWVTPNQEKTKPWNLYSEIRQGFHQPAREAYVEAHLYHHATGKETILQLNDSGEGNPDIRQNDGIYSRGLTGVFLPGYYTLMMTAKKYSSDAETDLGETSKEVSLFHRVTIFGSLYINSSRLDFPPRRIVDLHISDVRTMQYGVKHFIVQWTAPGNNFDSGIADRYEMKVFRSRNDALTNFNEKQVLSISEWETHGPWLKPAVAGTLQTLIIQLSNLTSGFYYLAMKGIHTDGIGADVSNVVKLYHKEPSYPLTTSSSGSTILSTDGISEHPTNSSESTIVDKQEDGTDLAVIIGATCGVLFLMIVIAIFLLFYLTRKTKARKSKKDTISPPYFPRKRSNTNEPICNGSQNVIQASSLENPAYTSDFVPLTPKQNPNGYYSIPTISRRVQDNVSIASTNDSILYSSLRRGFTQSPAVNNSFYDVPLSEDRNVAPFNPDYTSSLRRAASQLSRTYRLGTDV